MSYYTGYKERPSKCANYEAMDGYYRPQSKLEAKSAFENSEKKNLKMMPCPACLNCTGYVFAGGDSGGIPFCYNFEEKPTCRNYHG